MGGGISVCNKTDGTIHVAVGHMCPLEFHNFLQPDECMTRNGIGNTFMYIETRPGFNGFEYDASNSAWAIASLSLTIVGLACPLVLGAASIAGVSLTAASSTLFNVGAASVNCYHLLAGAESVIVAVAGGGGLTAIVDLIKNTAYKQNGFYTNCMRWDIVGGPTYPVIDGNKVMHIEHPYSITNGRHYDCH